MSKKGIGFCNSNLRIYMRRFLLFLLLVSPLLASAQKKDGTLVAEIIHKESGEPLIAATLRMHSLPD